MEKYKKLVDTPLPDEDSFFAEIEGELANLEGLIKASDH
jgi:hypothetical protein